jgi:uncharacterized protein (DUF305 family)
MLTHPQSALKLQQKMLSERKSILIATLTKQIRHKLDKASFKNKSKTKHSVKNKRLCNKNHTSGVI